MSKKNATIDQKEFRKLVFNNPGINRLRVKDLLCTGFSSSSDTYNSRMTRAQDKAIKDGWLFVQDQGRGRNYYMNEFALENGIKRSIEPVRRDFTAKGMRMMDPAVKRQKLIDSLWICRSQPSV